MPGRDGTGPVGMGPMTGRGMGYCSGVATPGYANPVAGRGFRMGFGCGRGLGGGRGRRNMFYATGLPGWMRFGGYATPYQKPTPEIEKQVLKSQAEALQTEMDAVKRRLDEIESGSAVE